MAGNASRRACTNISPSSGSSVAKTASAPAASQTCCIVAISSARAGPGASDCATSNAAADRSRPIDR